MLRFVTIVALCCVSTCSACLPIIPFQPNNTAGIGQAFIAEGFVGTLVSTPPPEEAHVTYSSVAVDVNATVTRAFVSAAPTSVTWPSCDQAALYTVAIVERDVPSPAPSDYLSPWRLWLVSNVRTCQVLTGVTATVYQSPGQVGSGPAEHRVVTLVYRQNAQVTNTVTSEQRQTWSPLTYSVQHGLSLVAAHYYRVNIPANQFGRK